MNILGLWDGHDAGAALLQSGRLRFAVNEERLSRRKLEVHFPSRSIEACLAFAGVSARDVDVVAISTSDPAKTLGRWWPGSKERYYAVRRRKSQPGRLSGLTRAAKYRITEWGPGPVSRTLSRLALRRELARHGLHRAELHLVDHHDAHAAPAAMASGFDACSVLTIDGLGDGLSATVSAFRSGGLKRVAASPARHSVGVFFEHVTNLLNMRELEDEGKVMALADYAAPIDDADNPLLASVRVREGVIETVRPGHAMRSLLAPIHWRFANEQFAFLAQRVVERTCVALASDAVRLTGLPRLALAGGVVSNVKATRQIRLLPELEDVYVFPHMGDGGLALGAAVIAGQQKGESIVLELDRLDLGPGYEPPAIVAALEAAGLTPRLCDNLACGVGELLANGRIVMWFQGRMEYGPRALGQRSVLARPDRPDLRDRLNLVLKRRVWYQPFCPSMLESEGARILADFTSARNRCMTMAFQVSGEHRSALAGVISVDGTCRPQLVPDDEAGAFADLLRNVRGRWGIGAVLNTSFNIHGEPLVCSPSEAADVFLRSGADHLAIGPFLVERPVHHMNARDGARWPPLSPALIAAGTAVLVALAAWLARTPQGILRDQLMRWQFWSLEACALLALGLGVVVVRSLSRELQREDVVRMAALATVALALTLFVAPRTNRIYYDEQIYQSIGQSLSDLRRAQMCLDGNVEYGRLQCSIGEYNKQPYAYPHLLSLVYRLAGVDARWAFVVNAAAMALTVCGVYLITLFIFGDGLAAFFAGLILALTPQQLLWSATAAVEPLASMACVGALAATAYFARARTTMSLVAVGVMSAYAVQFRVESLLILPVVGLVLWRLAGDELRRSRVWWVALLCLVLVAVHLAHLYSVRSEGWGTTDARLSWRYVAPNFAVNGRFYAGDERFPVAYTVLALAGLMTAGQTVARAAMLFYFVAFFGIGLLFYAGSYNYGADVRYSLMTYPPLAMLGGLGAVQLARWLDRISPGVPARWVVGTGLVAQFLWYAPLVRATTEEAWAARADVRFAESVVSELPPNSYVLTHNPGMFHVWGMNAGQMSLASEQPGRLQFLADRYAGGVYLHWNFWCNVADPVQQSFCRKVLGMAPSHVWKEHRERDQRFAFHRFDVSPSRDAGGGDPPASH